MRYFTDEFDFERGVDVRIHLEEELKDLNIKLLKMGAMVEEIIAVAINSLKNQDLEMAETVVKLDDQIDQLELELEQKCMLLLALQQPLASDLRRIGTVMKIITDLERMGDHSVNISKITLRIGKSKLVTPLVDLPRMAEIAQEMVKGCLNSFLNEDIELAKEIARKDELVDEIYATIYDRVLKLIEENVENTQQLTQLLFVARFVERIADYTTNICERVIYMITGERVEIN
ncbi:MAG: phosphate signaling complex protein PhoU [Bacillota bacterium]